MILTASLNSYFPDADIGVDSQLACAEELLQMVVGETLGYVAQSVELVDRLEAADTAEPGPAVGRLLRAAGPSAQEIGDSALGQVADAVGHIPDGDSAVLNQISVDDAAEIAHGCLHVSHGFQHDENKADECLVDKDSNWGTEVLEGKIAEFGHCSSWVLASLCTLDFAFYFQQGREHCPMARFQIR